MSLHAAAADKPKRRATGGGWEDLLDVPQDQRGAPPTPQQLALLQEQVTLHPVSCDMHALRCMYPSRFAVPRQDDVNCIS